MAKVYLIGCKNYIPHWENMRGIADCTYKFQFIEVIPLYHNNVNK